MMLRVYLIRLCWLYVMLQALPVWYRTFQSHGFHFFLVLVLSLHYDLGYSVSVWSTGTGDSKKNQKVESMKDTPVELRNLLHYCITYTLSTALLYFNIHKQDEMMNCEIYSLPNWFSFVSQFICWQNYLWFKDHSNALMALHVNK